MDDGGFLAPFLARAEAEPARVFLRFEGRPLTFGQLARQAEALAAHLAGRGLGPGDRVAVMMDNGPALVAVIFGLARAGLVWVPLNTRQRGEGLRYVLDHSEPRLAIADTGHLETIAQCGFALGDDRVLRHTVGAAETPLLQVLATAAPCGLPLPRPSDLAAIMYTSGTTGPPKGVCVTQRMLRLAGEGAALVADARDGDLLFLWEPLGHIGGAQVLMLPVIREVAIAMVSRFSAGRFWREVCDSGATHIHYLGGVLQILLKQPADELDRAHRLRIAWGGGCPAETWRPFEERFGVSIRECYGMTEASSFTTCNASGLVGSVGRPLPWLSLAIQDSAGAPLPTGERGEIVVRSADPTALFAGYFRNPQASARALQGGALHTGDLGSLDGAGNLFFHGRLTESLRVKGENVSAWEVEHIANRHPAVEESAAVGVAAEVGEQDILLFVKPRAGAALDFPALADWLAGELAAFQLPRYYARVEDFERTPSQRIMKHRLPAAPEGMWDRLARRSN